MTDTYEAIPAGMTPKEYGEWKVNECLSIEEKREQYPESKYVWRNSTALDIRKNGEVKKQRGRQKGSKNVSGYNSGGRFNAAKQREFLKKAEQYGTLSAAAASVGFSRRAVYNHLEKNALFKSRFEAAVESYRASLEDLVDDRIRNGTRQIKKDGEGNVIEEVIKDDNTLLLRALERHDPDAWGKRTNNKTEVNVNHNTGSATAKLAEALGISLPDKSEEPIDITDYEEQ